jgi:MarR family transcriptional regulator, organic hydroperoxide resistance regulator
VRSAAKGRIEETTGYLLARVCKAHRGSVDATLVEVGLHVGQEMVLLRLWRRDGLSPSELADRLGVEPPTVTNMLSRMEKAGFLERRRDSKDARCTRVYLTKRGRELRESVERRWDAVEERAFARLTAEEETLLRGLLARIHDNLTQEPGAGE